MSRGVNGIDGLIASDAGPSDGRPLLLILGDCSCLWGQNSEECKFRMIYFARVVAKFLS
jgi:2-succinyl-5-enolpyruvyl-6-hydroxy-3-cyclohexene-1-carboxylate synthase